MRAHPCRSAVPLLWTLAALAGCGGDDGPSDGGGSGDVPLGASQLSVAQRAVAAGRLELIASQFAGLDPEGAAAIGGLAAALQSEGWVTGVDATTALSLVGADERLAHLAASGRWGIFGGEIGVVTGIDPGTQLPTGSIIRGVAMLRDTIVIVGFKRWGITDAETSGIFPSPGSGYVFDGAAKAWVASAGGVQLTTADSVLTLCSGVSEAGLSCNNASFANGALNISASQPLAGTAASGSYTAGFGNTRLRGYRVDVVCAQSPRC